jgi:hypothetical protein
MAVLDTAIHAFEASVLIIHYKDVDTRNKYALGLDPMGAGITQRGLCA